MISIPESANNFNYIIRIFEDINFVKKLKWLSMKKNADLDLSKKIVTVYPGHAVISDDQVYSQFMMMILGVRIRT